MIKIKSALMCLILILFVHNLNAQLVLPSTSQRAEVYQKIGNTDVTINYSRPGVKERKIWGGLVPYNELWRTGANAATTIEFSTDVTINENVVPAGKYAIFTIPTEKDWTIILNKNHKQGGTADYKQEEDQLRFTVTPKAIPHPHDWLFFTFFNIDKNSSNVLFVWEKLSFTFKIVSNASDSDGKLRASPLSKVNQMIGVTDVKVRYGSPAVKGRKVYGELVPYNKVWRTGANESTNIEFNTDVKIDGKTVPAGKYALFTIPTENEWTVIINKDAAQWGAFNYDESKDVLKFKVKPMDIGHHERLIMLFEDLSENSASLNIEFEKKKISIKIETDVAKLGINNIKEAIKVAKADDWRVYASGANFAIDHNTNLDEAKTWAEKAISMKDHYLAHFALAKYYEMKGDKMNAKTALEKAITAGKKESFFYALEPMFNKLAEKLK